MNLQNQHYRAHTPQPYHIKGGCGGSVPAKCCSAFAAVTPIACSLQRHLAISVLCPGQTVSIPPGCLGLSRKVLVSTFCFSGRWPRYSWTEPVVSALRVSIVPSSCQSCSGSTVSSAIALGRQPLHPERIVD